MSETETKDYLDRLDDLDRERRLLALIAKSSAETAANTKPRLLRTKMTVREKSQYIAQNGKDAYLSLPK